MRRKARWAEIGAGAQRSRSADGDADAAVVASGGGAAAVEGRGWLQRTLHLGQRGTRREYEKHACVENVGRNER